VGTAPGTLRPGLVGPYDRGTGEPAAIADFIRFHGDHRNAPEQQEAVWILSQLARWGLCPFPADWEELADRVQRRDLFRSAAAAVGHDATAAPPPTAGPIRLFESDCLDPCDPLAYLSERGLPVPAGGAPGLRPR
jgi:nitrate/nitrite transport system ATP-binding protein